jgi:hypothetical protein
MAHFALWFIRSRCCRKFNAARQARRQMKPVIRRSVPVDIDVDRLRETIRREVERPAPIVFDEPGFDFWFVKGFCPAERKVEGL